MNYLVLGAGLMGHACIFDLVNSPGVQKVTAIDVNEENLKSIAQKVKSDILQTKILNIHDKKALLNLMKEHNTVISAISYRFNYELTKMAIEAGCHFCDLGGNNTIVEKQYSLHEEAKKQNVTVIPDCGLAPGLSSNLAALAISKFDTVDFVKIRVGGLPQTPEPPLNYSLFFSTEGLINEYYEIPLLLRNHELVEGMPLGDLEDLSFPEFPELEAFNTSGGTSTLPKNFADKVKDLDYKTIRYRGHCEQMRTLFDLGLMDYDIHNINGIDISPRDVLMYQLEQKLSRNVKDVILLRVSAEGDKSGLKSTYSIEIIDYYDGIHDISAMMRMTTYPVSIIAQMLANNEIVERGVVSSELVVNNENLVECLKKRDINVRESVLTH
jgi:lysine 6-dehydrogenase